MGVEQLVELVTQHHVGIAHNAGSYLGRGVFAAGGDGGLSGREFGFADRPEVARARSSVVCIENSISVDDVMESPKLAE
jgi:hypothetical protein